MEVGSGESTQVVDDSHHTEMEVDNPTGEVATTVAKAARSVPELKRRNASMPYCRGGKPDKQGVYSFCQKAECGICSNKQMEVIRTTFERMGSEDPSATTTGGRVWAFLPEGSN